MPRTPVVVARAIAQTLPDGVTTLVLMCQDLPIEAPVWMLQAIMAIEGYKSLLTGIDAVTNLDSLLVTGNFPDPTAAYQELVQALGAIDAPALELR